MPLVVLKSHEHFHRRSARVVTESRNDGLVKQMEAVFLQRGLQTLQPLNLTRVARQRFVARRVNGDTTTALLLRHVACGVGGSHQLFERTALARHLDEADRRADVEDLVFPHEAVIGDDATHVVCNLTCLLQRTADQQHAELVATETRHRVAVTDCIAQKLCYFAQHAVAGQMPAGVVHDLEAIEVQVTQHVLTVAAVTAVHRFFETTFEFAAIHEAGKRIVRGLIGHLPRKSTQFRDVMEQDDGAGDLLVAVANRRGGQLDRTLRAVGFGKQQRAAAEIDRRASRQCLLYRIAEQATIGFIHQADDVFERLADRCVCRGADETLCGGVEIGDSTVRVSRDDRFGE